MEEVRQSKEERATKMSIIEQQILPAVESIIGPTWPNRLDGLLQMPIEELAKTGQSVSGSKSARSAMDMIVADIANANHARDAREQQRFESLGGQATVSMHL